MSPGHGGDADTGCTVWRATGCSPAQLQPQGQMCGMELRGLSLSFAVWLEHIWFMVGAQCQSVCLIAPLSFLLLPPGLSWDTRNQGYSQDVGDDAYAPAKQRTVKSGPPGSNPGPARDSPHGSQGKWPLAPPW